MAARLYKLIVRLKNAEPKDLPRLIHAIQLVGRQLHATATMLQPDGLKPDILLYGEDLDYKKPEV